MQFRRTDHHPSFAEGGVTVGHPRRRPFTLALLALVAALASLLLMAGPASAAPASSVPVPATVTHISNNALEITYAGQTHICYYGDLCMYRGGYKTYYICQTVSNSVTSGGFIINNQYGSPSTATLTGRNGAGNYTVKKGQAFNVDWYYFSKFKSC